MRRRSEAPFNSIGPASTASLLERVPLNASQPCGSDGMFNTSFILGGNSVFNYSWSFWIQDNKENIEKF
jgi:hypothetical protein